jgi:hypothetical protein
MMKIHALKTCKAPFAASAAGDKDFEWRQNDRGFEVGDVLILCEYDEKEGIVTGRTLVRGITYILRNNTPIGSAIPPGFCIMSVRPIP